MPSSSTAHFDFRLIIGKGVHTAHHTAHTVPGDCVVGGEGAGDGESVLEGEGEVVVVVSSVSSVVLSG